MLADGLRIMEKKFKKHLYEPQIQAYTKRVLWGDVELICQNGTNGRRSFWD